jgi:hypothetical protein
MIVRNYDMPQTDQWRVCHKDSVDVFRESSVSLGSEVKADLLVWKDALANPVISSAMAKVDWPLRMLSGLSQEKGWNWVLKSSLHTETDSVQSWDEILECIANAAGVKGEPSGNVAVTLNLRGYEELESGVGGFEWWKHRLRKECGDDTYSDAFLAQLTYMLGQTKEAGLNLHVEQISIILSKDASSPVATLTPTLHSDMYYGVRETALVSLTEKGTSGFSGTLFAPTVRMDTLEAERPIDVHKMMRLLDSEPIVEAGSGDLLLYSGMIGSDGATLTANGVPHISPDIPGRSARVVILMRNIK